MEKFLWLLFYGATIPILGAVFFHEKKVSGLVEKGAGFISQKLSFRKSIDSIYANFITKGLLLGLTMIFFAMTDRTPSSMFKNREFFTYLFYIVNFISVVTSFKLPFLWILNLFVMIWGRNVFGISDSTFYIWNAVSNALIPFIIFYSNIKRGKEIFVKEISSIGKGIVLLGSFYLITFFMFGNYVIPTGSMRPVIMEGDRIVANMMKYKFFKPKAGEVVTFENPELKNVFYTKRIAGTPGDTLKISEGSKEENLFNSENSDFLYNKLKNSDEYYQKKSEFELKKIQEVGGGLLINGKKQIYKYLPEGLLKNHLTYIPKKGDIVYIERIVKIRREKFKSSQGKEKYVTKWKNDGYSYPDTFEYITTEDFRKNEWNQSKNFKDIIGNDVNNSEYYYTFLLKVKGRNEMVLPIMDLKYNDEIFNELLKGKDREAIPEEIGDNQIKQNFYDVDKTISAADIAMNTGKGISAGIGTAVGTWALVSTYGVASTGTAIATLSGAAATNATLAWLGGGSLAAGGGGMAAGSVVLGGIVAIPALALTGLFSHLKANKKIKEIEEKIYEVREANSKIKSNISGMEFADKRAIEIIDSLEKGKEVFESELKKAYNKIYPIPFFSALFKSIRKHIFRKAYFSEEDVAEIKYIGEIATNFAQIIDSKVF